jgi:hypothetical protein
MADSDSFMFASLAEELGTGVWFQVAEASLKPFRFKSHRVSSAVVHFLVSSRHGTVMPDGTFGTLRSPGAGS